LKKFKSKANILYSDQVNSDQFKSIDYFGCHFGVFTDFLPNFKPQNTIFISYCFTYLDRQISEFLTIAEFIRFLAPFSNYQPASSCFDDWFCHIADKVLVEDEEKNTSEEYFEKFVRQIPRINFFQNGPLKRLAQFALSPDHFPKFQYIETNLLFTENKKTLFNQQIQLDQSEPVTTIMKIMQKKTLSNKTLSNKDQEDYVVNIISTYRNI
jgi:hypothetical protein